MDNKILQIYGILLEEFGLQGWWPLFENGEFIYDRDNKNKSLTPKQQFQIILGAILTQNTTWTNVEKTFKALNLLCLISETELRNIKQEQLAELIRTSGYYNQKAKKIKAIISFLESGKEITRENLLKVWGIGEETADSILLYSYNQPFFVIDTYTKRISSRIGYKERKYEELQELFHKNLSKDYKLFNEYHALLVKLGKEICKKEPLCDKCPLKREYVCAYDSSKEIK